MLFPDLVDVPIEVFGGYCPAIPPSDLSPGAAAVATDVIFPQGAVRQRGGLQNAFPGSVLSANAAINGLKSYLTPTLGKRLLAWDSVGNLYKENPQGTITLLASRPYAGLFYQSQTLFGREYQAFFNSLGGFDIPRQYDDSLWDRVSQSGPGVSPAAVDSGTAGNIAVGKHQVSVAFITRQGFITQAAPPVTWTAAGTKQVALSDIPIGPPNIVARLILFTPVITAPATTGSFYSLPTGTSQLATPTAMLINDNTTTTITLDFTDAILSAGFAANYLFTQLELGESAFTIGYNSRLAWLGERNKQPNFLNLGFDGGFGKAGGAGGSANTGATSPSIATSAGAPPVPPANVSAWANPQNVFAVDGVLATCVLLAGFYTQYLNASGYGFAIPSNATISGIVVTALTKGDVAFSVSDFSVLLLKAGVQVGSEHANGNIWGTVLANQTYGSSADLWGTTWTPADINSNNFGVAYAANNNNPSNTRTASIDYISITVYYTTPVAGATVGPWGWTQGATFAGGASALSKSLTADWGDAFAITGDGATAQRGLITQSAYQDYLLQPIIARNTAYRVRARAASASGLVQGTLHIRLQSTSGAWASAGLAVQANQLTGIYQEFDALLTTAIVSPPTDLVIQVYADGTPTNNGVFLIDSIEVYPASTPFNYSTARVSHAFNPESYDATTGQIQIRPNDGQMLRAAFPLRSNLYFAKDHYLCSVADDGINEPSSWTVNEVSATIGICGPNAVDWTEEWAVFAERSGAYICWGADPVKITPEIQSDASAAGMLQVGQNASFILVDSSGRLWKVTITDGGILQQPVLVPSGTPTLVYLNDAGNLHSYQLTVSTGGVLVTTPVTLDTGYGQGPTLVSPNGTVFQVVIVGGILNNVSLGANRLATPKVSWASINWAAGHTIWVRIDKANKLLLIGAPINGATTPNVVFMLDYKWLETAEDIAKSELVTYSAFTGKMLSHGRGRRWAIWSITANSMTFAERADGTAQPFFGNGAGNGKIYQQLDASVQASDDGAAVTSAYQSYNCPSHMEEQMYRLSAHRKLLGYLKFRAWGAGTLNLSVSTAQRTTMLRSYTLSLTPAGDGERPLNVHGERFAINVSSSTAGAWWQLEKLIPCVKKDAAIPVRGVSA